MIDKAYCDYPADLHNKLLYINCEIVIHFFSFSISSSNSIFEAYKK